MGYLDDLMHKIGVFQYGFVKTTSIRFLQEVRKMCEVNTCQQYGKTWACPPAIGTVDECRQKIQAYDTMLLFSVKYDLEDSFDYEGMKEGMAHFKQICRALHEALEPHLESFLILSNEGCDLCESCTYPNAPCRFPNRSHGSLEGYGILVSEVAKQAGIHYINGANTVTYFGALLLSDQALETLQGANSKKLT